MTAASDRPNGRKIRTTTAQVAVGDPIDAIESALTQIARRINLPRSHDALVARAGVDTTIDRATYSVLRRIGDEGAVRLTDLAQVLGVDLSTVSRQVQTLERQALVSRSSDPSDRRATVIALSDLGRTALDRLREATRARLGDVMTSWTDAERAELARALQRFNDAVESQERP